MTAHGATAELLALLLPGPDETALLEACLHTGARAVHAWERWRARPGASSATVCRDLARTRTLLPLLARSAARNGLALGPEALAYVRAAALREEVRSVRVRRLSTQALAALAAAGTTAYAARGVALAATVYESWSLRHCHDVDILVPAAEQERAVRALAGAGFHGGPRRSTADGGARLVHGSGLALAAHTRVFAVPYYEVPLDAFVRSARAVDLDGTPARVPAPEALLVHVLGHATYSASRANLRWVADAWHVVAAHPDLDWSDVVARVAASRLAVPVATVVGYLAMLGVSIPDSVAASLRELAARSDRAAQDVALGGVHAAIASDTARMWRASISWRGRLRLIRWAVAPSRAYMRSAFAAAHAWSCPIYYVYRPLRFLARHLTGRPGPWRRARASTDSAAAA
ncbi:MAG TPA: nucleotidyltransferase family protein [Methylomirabilota bacterium]|jgi:hypothetical protein|nr:nucleotidyltransferase family protein [Methylomirabilota bacterium]